jgi:two-component system, sensor histidine kinase and response regulator
MVRNGARHLLSLINNLLDLAKIESGRVHLQFEPVVCQEVISDVIQSLRPLAEEKGLDLQIDVPQDPVTIQTDHRALKQILTNLTNNAIRFTEQGWIRVSLTVVQAVSGSRMEIAVTDTGIGIRAEDQAMLFGAFQQIASSQKKQVEGTGQVVVGRVEVGMVEDIEELRSEAAAYLLTESKLPLNGDVRLKRPEAV